MAHRKHQHPLQAWQEAVQRQIAGAAPGNHQFPVAAANLAADFGAVGEDVEGIRK
jgi:hypothetical protein